MKLLGNLSIGLILSFAAAIAAVAPPKVESYSNGIVAVPQERVSELVAALKKDKRSGLFKIKGYSVYVSDATDCAYYIPKRNTKTWMVGNRCPKQTRFDIMWGYGPDTITSCLGSYPMLEDTRVSYNKVRYPYWANKVAC